MIDSHCHLADDAFVADVGAVIERARGAGVQGALCILDAANATERERAFALPRLWPALRFAIGIHPHHAAAWAGRTGELVATVREALAEQSASRAVGEIGLDYHYDFSPRAVQREVFAAQLDLAVTEHLPVVIHAREADDDVDALVREAVARGRLRGVMHCFTGDIGFARRCLDHGLLISLAGIVTFPRAESLRDVARFVPEDRLLVETDSPFLAPVPRRGKRNEPAWVLDVGTRIAEVRGVTPQVVAERTSANYEALFHADRPGVMA